MRQPGGQGWAGPKIVRECGNEEGPVLAEGHPQAGQLTGDNTAHVVSFLQSLVPMAARL